MGLLNSITLEGRVCGDVKVYEGGKTKVARFNLRHWHGKYKGEDMGASFVSCVVFGTPVDWLKLEDKQNVIVTGRFKINEREKDGKKYKDAEIHVTDWSVGGTFSGSGGSSQSSGEDQEPAKPRPF